MEGLWGQILSLVNGGSALAWALELSGNNGKSGSLFKKVGGKTVPKRMDAYIFPDFRFF